MYAIPRHVRKFLKRNIRSVDHLRVLLHVFENPEQNWTPVGVSARLHLDRRTAERALADLAERGLLVRTNERGSAYSMAGLSRVDLHTIDRLRQLDQVAPVTLINLVATPGQYLDATTALKDSAS